MNVYLISVYFVFYTSTWIVGSRMICKQKEFDKTEVLICPPEDAETSLELNYCCLNNGLLSCCDYNDYYQRHFGPSIGTTILIIVCNGVIIGLLCYWCYKRYNRNRLIAN